MDVTNMNISEFRKLPHRKWDEQVICDSLIILPVKYDLFGMVKYKIKNALARLFGLSEPDIWSIGHIHDSGFRCMDFVACKKNEPVCLLSGCSDVVHIEGIGGLGYNWFERFNAVPTQIEPAGWSMDCLPKSGLLRIFPNYTKSIICAEALSSFEIYSSVRTEVSNVDLVS